ncbi:MAG TPA: LON peptidase substrate-binding domain-containing protein [Gemmatimonadaceae bacterium]|nr:LON peptidase substrate-binding domain-containing protein [Gemmatimonadaceae bacterium]
MSVYLLPLFPLPLVLFPSAPLPLHIFEPRYRQMVSDCMERDSRFGIVYRPESVNEADLESGRVGCVAEIDDAHSLPDGRSNIVVRGVKRFTLERFVTTASPYHVGEVSEYDDVPESVDALAAPAARVRSLFNRVGKAARTLSDDHDPLPTLPDQPDALSFAVAALIDIEPERRQALLTSQLASERLSTLEALLGGAVESLEARAKVHGRAKSNGRGHHVAK